jgi:CHRD domain-containing protein
MKRLSIFFLVMAGLLVTATVAGAEQISALLTGYEESPAVSTVNGSVVIFLCQTASNPDPTGLAPQCPQEGTVTGVITSANVIQGSMAPQQLSAGDLAAVITALRAGAAYANVHTQVSPGGEIRGQIRTVGK